MAKVPTPMEDPTAIYFSDLFEISRKVVEDYGAFDVSLVNDLPLFIDPFLLFNSPKPDYQELHDEIITYVRFLRDKSTAGEIDDGLLQAWFTFPEVKQNWFGYSQEGNVGSGLGMKFAREFNANLSKIFGSFGAESVTAGSHIEKVLLVSSGVGRDNISDFVTNAIKHYLLRYTEAFAAKNLRPEQRQVVAVDKVRFNYETETWEKGTYELPFVNGDYVILTPIDLLTKDEVWINKTDLFRDYPKIAASVDDHQLRAQINNYFTKTLEDIRKRDAARKPPRRKHDSRSQEREPAPNSKQRGEAAFKTISEFPGLIDYYIRYKEEHGEEAEQQADARVRSTERLFVSQVRNLARKLLQQTAFYDITGTTLEEARLRVAFLKDVIENHGGWELLYADGEPLYRESEIRIVFRLTWLNAPSGDISRQTEAFKFKLGKIVQFKLAKSTRLSASLQEHKQESEADHLTVIVCFTNEERARAIALLDAFELESHPDIILIDAQDRSDSFAREGNGGEET